MKTSIERKTIALYLRYFVDVVTLYIILATNGTIWPCWNLTSTVINEKRNRRRKNADDDMFIVEERGGARRRRKKKKREENRRHWIVLVGQHDLFLLIWKFAEMKLSMMFVIKFCKQSRQMIFYQKKSNTMINDFDFLFVSFNFKWKLKLSMHLLLFSLTDNEQNSKVHSNLSIRWKEHLFKVMIISFLWHLISSFLSDSNTIAVSNWELTYGKKTEGISGSIEKEDEQLCLFHYRGRKINTYHKSIFSPLSGLLTMTINL